MSCRCTEAESKVAIRLGEGAGGVQRVQCHLFPFTAESSCRALKTEEVNRGVQLADSV